MSASVSRVIGLSQQMHQIASRSAADPFLEAVRLDHVVCKTEVYKWVLGLSKRAVSDFARRSQCGLSAWYFEGNGR